MRHKDTIALYDYWNEIRAGRDAPLRTEISPAALGRLLPSVMLLERRDNGEIVFRLAGTKLCNLRCAELKGKQLTDLFRHADRLSLVKVLHSVERQNALVVLDAVARRRDGNAVVLEMAFMPLADETTRILGIISMAKAPYWFGADPAELEIRGIRYMDPQADLVFLQSRPSVILPRGRESRETPARQSLHIVKGDGLSGAKRGLRAFRVYDGGKK
ncbi:MAG: PAS domain-containing protein [Oricola sp.]